jgi:hypothetical protein
MSSDQLRKELDEFKAKRNRALLEMDLTLIADMIEEEHGKRPDRETLELIAHKLRYECVDLPREARLKSATFLRKNKYSRWKGGPLLAHGELPE